MSHPRQSNEFVTRMLARGPLERHASKMLDGTLSEVEKEAVWDMEKAYMLAVLQQDRPRIWE